MFVESDIPVASQRALMAVLWFFSQQRRRCVLELSYAA